jgi:hypothetical protein
MINKISIGDKTNRFMLSRGYVKICALLCNQSVSPFLNALCLISGVINRIDLRVVFHSAIVNKRGRDGDSTAC